MNRMVLHLIGQLGRGGAEKQLFHIATGLQRRGWPQAVVAFDTSGVWEPRLKDAGIPFIAFKYAENSGQMQPIREQAGTFADSIKLWSGR